MLRSDIGFLLLGLTMSHLGPASAADTLTMLEHNPFNKPAILAAPPPQLERKKQSPVTDVMPRLSAILISDNLPMVIADDEILSPGDDINGYRLLSVDEGRAVFEKLGKTYTLLIEDDDVKDNASQRQ